MDKIERIYTLPENAPLFYNEMALGIENLYGPRASKAYRKTIDNQITHAIQHPQVITLTYNEKQKTAAICSGIVQDRKASIVLLHLLAEYQGQGIEARLLNKMIEKLSEFDLDGIIYENLPLFDAEVKETFAKHGFSHLPRALMNGPLRGGKPKPYASISMIRDQFTTAASILVDSYTGHQDRILHQEIRTEAAAVKLITNIHAGMYGACDPAYLRFVKDNGEPVGIILGCETVEGVGFILQVAVKRSAQGNGFGKIMMEEMKDIFSAKGLDIISLGVTEGNPAQKLYSSCGMETVKHIDSFARWNHPVEI